MAKWTGLLKQLVSSKKPLNETKLPETSEDDPDSAGWQYIHRLREKLSKLVEDFSEGRVNREQFEELYAHYQKERETIERLIATRPDSDAWRMAVTEGESVNIRRRLAARVLGYAVYTNQDQMALRVYGEFAALDEEWVPSLLAKLQQDVSEPFVVSVFDTRSEDSEDAAGLCAVPGEFTTLVVLFTKEPAPIQIQSLQDLHCHFERANRRILTRSQYQVSDLVFPYAAAFE